VLLFLKKKKQKDFFESGALRARKSLLQSQKSSATLLT
jgi:hypothetical protein